MDFWTNKNKWRKAGFKRHKKDGSVKMGLWHTAVLPLSVLYLYHTRKEKPCSQMCSKLLYMSLVLKNLKTQKVCTLTDTKWKALKKFSFLRTMNCIIILTLAETYFKIKIFRWITLHIHIRTRTDHVCVSKKICQVELVTLKNTDALKSFQVLKHIFAIYYNGNLLHIFK